MSILKFEMRPGLRISNITYTTSKNALEIKNEVVTPHAALQGFFKGCDNEDVPLQLPAHSCDVTLLATMLARDRVRTLR